MVPSVTIISFKRLETMLNQANKNEVHLVCISPWIKTRDISPFQTHNTYRVLVTAVAFDLILVALIPIWSWTSEDGQPTNDTQAAIEARVESALHLIRDYVFHNVDNGAVEIVDALVAMPKDIVLAHATLGGLTHNPDTGLFEIMEESVL